MKNNKTTKQTSASKKTMWQLVAIISLIVCATAMLGVAIWLGTSGMDKSPNEPTKSSTSDDGWTKNY